MAEAPAEEFEPTTAERVARNDAIFRRANEAIADAAERYGTEGKVPFVCECADPVCREIVRLSLDDYRQVRADPRRFLNVAGHQSAARGWAEVVGEGDGYVIVEKIGEAGDLAERLAERDRGE